MKEEEIKELLKNWDVGETKYFMDVKRKDRDYYKISYLGNGKYLFSGVFEDWTVYDKHIMEWLKGLRKCSKKLVEKKHKEYEEEKLSLKVDGYVGKEGEGDFLI